MDADDQRGDLVRGSVRVDYIKKLVTVLTSNPYPPGGAKP